MSPFRFRVRRATTDDIQRLRSLWETGRVPADELERRLTEFQVIESADGQIAGAIGIQIIRRHARLHGEAFADFSVADEARQLFWERVQLIASHHGVFRLWTQEDSPFWKERGFRIVITESLAQLPEEWKRFEGKWFALQIKDEGALATLEKELTSLRELEKQRAAQRQEKARMLTTIITVIGLVMGIALIGFALYLLLRRGSLVPMR